jgi:hypothetical protein
LREYSKTDPTGSEMVAKLEREIPIKALRALW